MPERKKANCLRRPLAQQQLLPALASHQSEVSRPRCCCLRAATVHCCSFSQCVLHRTHASQPYKLGHYTIVSVRVE